MTCETCGDTGWFEGQVRNRFGGSDDTVILRCPEGCHVCGETSIERTTDGPVCEKHMDDEHWRQTA